MSAQIKGLNQFLRDMKHAPRELQSELRKRAQDIAEPVAADARSRAQTAQQRMVAPTIRAPKDRIPVIKAGGGKVLSSGTPRRRRPRGGDVYFGADFGSAKLRQFPPRRKRGTMLFPAIKGKRKHIADQYLEAVEDVFKGRGI